MASLFGQYIKERTNREIIENHIGFATYVVEKDSIYIEDVFVIPSYRKSRVASDFVNQIAQIAKDKGIKKLYTSVVPTANGSTISLVACVKYGFKLDSSANNFILFVKEIE